MERNINEELRSLHVYSIHEELLPFIGTNYTDYRILLVGESHYLPDPENNPGYKPKVESDFFDWYKKDYVDIMTETNPNEKDYFRTSNLVECYMRDQRINKGWNIWYNTGKILAEVLTSINPNVDAFSAYQYVAFINYFQRPEINNGGSISASEEDKDWAKNNLNDVRKILEPKETIFLSKKAYNCYDPKDGGNISVVSHPTCPWWNRDNGNHGREKFREIIQNIIK